jgi:hypothetical protein
MSNFRILVGNSFNFKELEENGHSKFSDIVG